MCIIRVIIHADFASCIFHLTSYCVSPCHSSPQKRHCALITKVIQAPGGKLCSLQNWCFAPIYLTSRPLKLLTFLHSLSTLFFPIHRSSYMCPCIDACIFAYVHLYNFRPPFPPKSCDFYCDLMTN